jgi:hypothetical protein
MHLFMPLIFLLFPDHLLKLLLDIGRVFQVVVLRLGLFPAFGFLGNCLSPASPFGLLLLLFFVCLLVILCVCSLQGGQSLSFSTHRQLSCDRFFFSSLIGFDCPFIAVEGGRKREMIPADLALVQLPFP